MKSVLVGLACAGCASGTPSWFAASGDTWVLPLVDPLSDGQLVTPVMIDGAGPYPFLIDPDADEMVVDREIADRGQLYRTNCGAREIDERDQRHTMCGGDLFHLRVGSLEIREIGVTILPAHWLDIGDRRIYGVLNKTVIADSLVFGFDRQRGIAWLKTQEAFQPDPAASEIGYRPGNMRHQSGVTRRLVTADINGQRFDVHLILRDVPSQLRYQHWGPAKLKPIAWNEDLIDDIGAHRRVDTDGLADRVTVGNITREHIGFVPYDDRRWVYGELEGTLGLDFFRPFAVAANWHTRTFYLTPRTETPEAAKLRLDRWGGALAACPEGSCVTITVEASPHRSSWDLGMTPTRSLAVADVSANVIRAPAARGVPVEVMFGATARDGRELPPFYVHLPANVDQFSVPVEPHYVGAQFHVIDVSPFPNDCGGCITRLGAQTP